MKTIVLDPNRVVLKIKGHYPLFCDIVSINLETMEVYYKERDNTVGITNLKEIGVSLEYILTLEEESFGIK